jgi:NAD(P)-dependent dehydrogenase (short-subunit alcohol dehydrogenase family)
MKGLFLGAHSQFARSLLKNQQWSHLLLQSQRLTQLQEIVMTLPQGVSVELFPCDFLQPEESMLLNFQNLLTRFSHLDVIVLTVGSWNSFAAFEHLSLEELYIAWQVNYFYPLSLLKQAIPLAKKGLKLIAWTLEDDLLKQPLWTSIGPILSAWEVLVTQIAQEQSWTLQLHKTSFMRSAQSLKLFPSGNECSVLPEIVL